jgi:hypothetical protein
MLGNPMGFQRWVKPDKTIGTASINIDVFFTCVML